MPEAMSSIHEAVNPEFWQWEAVEFWQINGSPIYLSLRIDKQIVLVLITNCLYGQAGATP